MKVKTYKKNSINNNSLLLNLKDKKIQKENFRKRRKSLNVMNIYGTNDNNINSDDEYYSILNNILSYYQKGEFGHLLKLIHSINLSYNSFIYWKIMYMKILTFNEMIEYKLYIYFKNKTMYKFTKYFTIFIKDITEIINNLIQISSNKINKDNEDFQKIEKKFSFFHLKKNSKKNLKYLLQKNTIKKIIPEMIETLITRLLNFCYNFAKYCIYKRSLYESIAFLSLGIRLIQKSFLFATSPETLLISCNIYLFLSSLLILTKNYSTAKNFIILILIICFKALDLHLNIDFEKNMSFFFKIKIDSNDEIYSNKVYFLLSLAFYHFGICYENENDFQRAISLYQQSKYFDSKITAQYHENSDFDILLDNIINRLLIRQKLISFFKAEEKNKKILNDVVKMPKLLFEKFEIDVNIKKEKKYENVKNFINNLKLMEIDDDEPDLLNEIRGEPFSKNVGIVTKNIHIFNYLLSNKFNKFLNEANKIELNNLTHESKIKIQREIKFIKREEFEKYLKKRNNLKIKTNNETNNQIKRNIFHSNTITFNNPLKNNKISLNKNFSSENLSKNISMNINNINNTKVNKRKIERQMSFIDIPKLNIFKEEYYNSNINNLINTKNSLLNKIGHSSKELKNNSFLDVNPNTISRNNNSKKSQSFNKRNNINKSKLELNFSPFITSNNSIKKLKSTSTDTVNAQKTLKIIKNNKFIDRRNFLTELSCFNSDKNNKFKLKKKKKVKNKTKLQRFDKNIFNKKLTLKKNYLDNQYIRELKFQKELLKCKSLELYDNDTNIIGSNMNILSNSFNKQKIYNDCDVFFNKKIKEFMNRQEIPDEKEQLNLVNLKLKKENNKNEENEGITNNNSENINDKRNKRRGGIKESYYNHNNFFLEKIMSQINTINEKEILINLKLKENIDKIISKRIDNKKQKIQLKNNDKP